MSVAQHLHIQLDDYDARIRTFVPGYELMLAIVSNALGALHTDSPDVLDLGTGTGALAEKCLDRVPHARLIGVDNDAAVLQVAATRLADSSAQFIQSDFMSLSVPPCDAVVACIALHHIRSADQKREFYDRCAASLRPNGLFINADYFPARSEYFARQHRNAWLAHLEQSYSRTEAEDYLRAWAQDDVYFPLNDELSWLRAAQLEPEILWRSGGYAVIAARKS